MAYTLNTSHPLYGNIIELIGVEAGALVSHKTARTFTKHAEASYGTGTYGEHFRTVAGGFTAKGASIDPAVAINTVTTPNVTLLAVVNRISATGGGAQRCVVASTHSSAFTIGLTSTGLATALSAYNTLVSTSAIDVDNTTDPHVFAVVREGETAHKLYVDGAFAVDAPATKLAFNSAGTVWNYIGGLTGQASVAEDLVWLVWFDKLLSEAELDDLSASLGADNVFGLISAGGASYTLTLEAGAYTQTGQSILLPINVSCVLGNGTYLYTGRDLNLGLAGAYSIGLDAGVYTLTAIDANVGISSALEAGAYSLVGKAIRLVSSTETVLISNGNKSISVSLRIGL